MTGSFRLLDGRTGWPVATSRNLIGLDDPHGLRLATPPGLPGAVSADALAGCLPPSRTARDPRGLLYAAGRSRLRVVDLRAGTLSVVPGPAGHPRGRREGHAAALSWGQSLLAVVDPAGRAVDVFHADGLRPVFRIAVPAQFGRPRLAALTRWSLVAIVTGDPGGILLIGLDGVLRAHRSMPAAAWAAELGMVRVTTEPGGTEPALVLSVRIEPGWRRLLRLSPTDLDASSLDPSQVCRPSLHPALRVANDESWSIPAGDRVFAFTADGSPITGDPRPPVTPFTGDGELTTVPLDSGVDDCRWHRVRMDADQPPGTSIALDLATVSEDGPSAWQPIPANAAGSAAADALIRLPPGRSLLVRLRLHGDGASSPVVRRITADFDGSSSFDLLPAIYRSDAAAEDFTRRLVSLFDASLEEIDDAVRRAPRLFHPQPAEARTLTAIAAAIGIRPDPGWPAERLRELLDAWPWIWPALGTPDGLKSLITVLFGIDVLVDELGGHRPWASLSAAPLGAFRLFGTARASLRLGTGQLGVARLDPGRDPLGPAYGSGAFRCVVHAPSGLDDATRRSLESVVQTFTPGHVVAEVRYASASFVVGRAIAPSVGTRLGRLTPGVLNGAGEPAFVLARRSLLGRRLPGGVPVTVGRRSAVGITTRVR